MPATTEAKDLASLETPVLVLDEGKMDANIVRMRTHLRSLGVKFRPHVKTSKSVDVSRRILGGDSGPVTVSTLKEAEYFAGHGFADILYAVSITPNKLPRLFDLCARGIRMTVILDSAESAAQLVRYAAGRETAPAVMIEIDSDGHRSGVPPGSADLLRIAGILREGRVVLAGVLTHAGSSYHCGTTAAIAALARQERDAAVACALRLRADGHACPDVSVGSTPTALFARDLAGVTEVRAGVFVFGDLVMSGLGVTQLEGIAVSVLATVIGHQRGKGWTIVDAGWMAMSRDRGTSRQRVDQGYGMVCDLNGNVLDDVLMVDANQEHGVLAHRSGDPMQMPNLPIGTPVRILPNHACATCAQHDRYYVTDGGNTRIRAVWPRLQG